MRTLPCLSMVLCVVVPCCVTRSVKQHIDTNRSDLRTLNTNANIGGVESRNDYLNTVRPQWNNQGTIADDRGQITNGNIPAKTRSGSHTDRETKSNTLSYVNSVFSGQRRTSSNVGRDTNRSDKVVEGNITNYSIHSGVKYDTSPNDSTKKKKDERPNETIHTRGNGGTSRPQGVHKDIHQKAFQEAPPIHTLSGVGYSFLVLVGFILVLFCMVCLVLKCPISSKSACESQSEMCGTQQSDCHNQADDL
ncbi:uncharacterized protein [Haliotis asinina]|uniref:uncharacterized protein n=1 Tax=Haliotis asinina TaxID=109174 RepID=UPI003531EC6D